MGVHVSCYSVALLVIGIQMLITQQASAADTVKEFLQRYGYLPTFRPSDLGNEPTSIQPAIRAFQKFVGLPQTGVADSATLAKMSAPRCGNSDMQISFRRRRKRYVLAIGAIWLKKTFTYNIFDYSVRLHHLTLRRTMAKAFQYWSDVTDFRFVRRDVDNPDQVDIAIRFVVGEHGDRSPFDGPGTILAHAFYPRNGDIHFDDAEPWTTYYYPGLNMKTLLPVAVHEIGHSLGLNHSDNVDAVMAPYYRSYAAGTFRLHQDDINGIRRLYYSEQEATKEPPVKVSTPGGDAGRRPSTLLYYYAQGCSPGGCADRDHTTTVPPYPFNTTGLPHNPGYKRTTLYIQQEWNTVPGWPLIPRKTNNYGRNTNRAQRVTVWPYTTYHNPTESHASTKVFRYVLFSGYPSRRRNVRLVPSNGPLGRVSWPADPSGRPGTEGSSDRWTTNMLSMFSSRRPVTQFGRPSIQTPVKGQTVLSRLLRRF